MAMRVTLVDISAGIIVAEGRKLVSLSRTAEGAKLGLSTAACAGRLNDGLTGLPSVCLINRLGAS